LNKQELIEAVASRTELSKAEAGRAVDAVLEVITETLAKGEKVSLVGFGSFEVRHRQARMGRNPRTNEMIHVPATKVPAFKAGKKLKDAVK